MVNKKELNNEERLKNTHVPDKVYAYSLQVRHMLYELLDCSDSDTVSVEVYDDIAVEKEDGSIEAVQLKSVLSMNNPISNRAVDLWKTLYNWLIAIQQGELDPNKTLFRLFIAADKKGDIVNSFSEAENTEDASQAWENARNEFYNEDGDEKNWGEQYAQFVRSFFEPLNKTIACNIIKNFKLTTIKKSHTETLFEKFCQKLYIQEDVLEKAFIYILGWIDKKTATLIEQNQVMSIDFSEFKAQIVAITREFNQKLSLIELAPKPTTEEIEHELENIKIYIQQLEVIECEYTDKIEAISDYLRASTNRSLWASRGDITLKTLEEYEESLIRKWNTEKKIIGIKHKDSIPVEKGNLLYLTCKNNNINLGYLSVPDFFTPGCYHELSDDSVVGWHPDFQEIFKKGCENDGTSK